MSILTGARSSSLGNSFELAPDNVFSCPGRGEALIKASENKFSQFTFEENMSNFKTRLQNRDYPPRIVEKTPFRD